MITLGMWHQMAHKVLGHYVVHTITKFQNCRSDDNFFSLAKKKHCENILLRTIVQNWEQQQFNWYSLLTWE